MPSCLLARARIKLGRTVANFSIQNRRGSALTPLPGSRQSDSGDAVQHETASEALARQMRLLARELRWEGDDSDLEAMAVELLRRIAGPELNLDGLEPPLKQFVGAMPPEAWQAIQGHAHAAGGEGIKSVCLDAALASNRLVLQGLRELQTLEGVFMAVPAEGTYIDFGGLQSRDRPGRSVLPKIILRGDAPKALWLKVPLGVTVEAHGQSRPGLWPSLVCYVDSAGAPIGQPRPVHGQIHANMATEFSLPGVFPTDDPQLRAHAIRLNLSTEMSDGDQAVCRHLSAQWLNDHLDGAPLSYKAYSTPEAIRAHVPTSVNSDLARMAEQGSCALYTPDQFGSMVADRFAGMQAGDKRLFAVSTGGHMLGLQLLVRETSHGGVTRCEHVVHLYDPTYTAKHEEVTLVGGDLSLLRSKRLADFCPDKEAERDYFANGRYTVGSLFAWPPGPARQQGTPLPVSVHVSPQDMATAGFLYAALEDGHVALVRQSLSALRTQGFGMDKDQLKAIGGESFMPGLYRAVSTESPPEVVEEYLNQVLDFPNRHLPSATKLRLCSAEHRGETVLHCALERGHVDMVLSILRPVMGAPQALTRGERYRFLLAPSSTGQPMLSVLCAGPHSSPLSPERVFQCEAIHAYVKGIVNSPALSDAEKESLVSAYGGPPGGEQTAAKLALESGSPAQAAAMLLGVLESEAPPALKTRLLTALGVTADEVLKGFSQTQFDRSVQVWMFKAMLRIEAHALA